MGQLFAKLMSIFGSQEHKVIIVGLDNAGKTTILYQLASPSRQQRVAAKQRCLHPIFTFQKPHERGGAHVTHHRQQRGGDHPEEDPLPDVGHRGAGDAAVHVEHLLLQHGVCHPGDRQHRPRAADGDERGAVQDAGPRGPAECGGLDICQQAGCKELHDYLRDLQVPNAQLHQGPPMAHPGLLRPHGRGLASWLGVDEVSSSSQLTHLARHMTEQCKALKHLIYFFIHVSFSLDFPSKAAEAGILYGQCISEPGSAWELVPPGLHVRKESGSYLLGGGSVLDRVSEGNRFWVISLLDHICREGNQ